MVQRIYKSLVSLKNKLRMFLKVKFNYDWKCMKCGKTGLYSPYELHSMDIILNKKCPDCKVELYIKVKSWERIKHDLLRMNYY